MPHERTYKFIEEFLKWNFGNLPPEIVETLYGSPSFAVNMWACLPKIAISSRISMVLFESPKYQTQKLLLRDFIDRSTNNLTGTPVHFVTSIEHGSFEVHFDIKGDLTRTNKRIMSIDRITKPRVDSLIVNGAAPKILPDSMIAPLRSTFGNISKLYSGWRYRGKNEHWLGYEPYWRLIDIKSAIKS